MTSSTTKLEADCNNSLNFMPIIILLTLSLKLSILKKIRISSPSSPISAVSLLSIKSTSTVNQSLRLASFVPENSNCLLKKRNIFWEDFGLYWLVFLILLVFLTNTSVQKFPMVTLITYIVVNIELFGSSSPVRVEPECSRISPFGF